MGAFTADGSSNHCQWGQGGNPVVVLFSVCCFLELANALAVTRARANEQAPPLLLRLPTHSRVICRSGWSIVSQSVEQSIRQSICFCGPSPHRSRHRRSDVN